MTTRERDNYVYSGIVLGCIIFLFWIIPAYSPTYPGYGLPTTLMPNVAVGIIFALAALELVRNILKYRKDKTPSKPVPEDQKVRLWHFVKFMAPCVLVLPAMQMFGFIPVAVVFMILMQYICGQRKVVKALLVTMCTVGIAYAAMRYGLSVPMP